MGVSFTRIKPADFEILRRIAPVTSTGRTDVHPPGLQITDNGPAQPPKGKVPATTNQQSYSGAPPDMSDPPVTAEAFKAVVSLLFRKGLLTPSELTEELERRKVTHT
jgi:hypothetical protein